MATKLRRNTKQRQAILDVLCASKSHPTAAELFQEVRVRVPEISLGTVYRNLDVLAESGQVVRVHDGGHEARFDGNRHPHAHLQCTRCGRLGDVEVMLPDLAELNGSRLGDFLVTDHTLTLHGVCGACRSAG